MMALTTDTVSPTAEAAAMRAAATPTENRDHVWGRNRKKSSQSYDALNSKEKIIIIPVVVL